MPVITDYSVRLDLLSFLDFRSDKDLIAKKSIIARLYVFLEKANISSKYSEVRFRNSTSSREIDPYDDFFFICNRFNVRHGKDIGKDGQIDLPEDKTLELCNIAYYMFLLIFRIPIISDYHNLVSSLKPSK